MKKILILLIVCFTSSFLYAQRLHIGIFGGLANYNGDLTENYFPSKTTNGSIGVTANYELTNRIRLRAGYTYAVVGGADRFATTNEALMRNLSFETSIHEFSLLGELYLFDLSERRLSPYGFVGLAAFNFNPYAFDANLNKVYLQPLSTEGQGLPGYPDKKPYKLTQMAIPAGVGLKYALSDRVQIGAEFGYRKLFTDYLDDVSTTYADEADLLAARGPKAVEMAYRSDELPGGDPNFPAKDYGRGGAKYKDSYYFTGLHVSFRLGSGMGGGRKNRLGCPVNVY